jgi:flavin-dependent thymidylate synthase
MDSPLQVILAGVNVDVGALKEIKKEIINENKGRVLGLISELTPETISASYARISRDSRPIPELRAVAREEVEKARTTNQNLIFTMGHRSIAEHVFFNFDVMGLSRRAVEELERKRLQSYTEKSQRYITLKGDFVIPPEIKGTPLENDFIELIEKQTKFYNDNLNTLIGWHASQNPKADLTIKRDRDRIEGYGKEDARYALGMATQAQIGLSLTARNLERLVTELRSSESQEVKELGGKLLKQVNGIAPSVVKYTEPVNYYTKTRKGLKKYIAGLINNKDFFLDTSKLPNLSSKNVKLFTDIERDNSILAGLVFSSSVLPFHQCLGLIPYLFKEEKKEILNLADIYQEKHDPLLREYELGNRVAEIELSASAFAQMKRHRMNTIISQEYDINLKPIIPNSVEQTSLTKNLFEVALESSKVYEKMIAKGLPPIVAEYALTNAHKRRILLDANNRQIYSICAERENPAAQWDIRGLTKELHGLIQKESPLTTAYLCGKDTFNELKAKRYS